MMEFEGKIGQNSKKRYTSLTISNYALIICFNFKSTEASERKSRSHLAVLFLLLLLSIPR